MSDFTDVEQLGRHRIYGLWGFEMDCELVRYSYLDDNEAVPLTECCDATGKGSEVGIVCRSCYREVDPIFGTTVDLDRDVQPIPKEETDG